MRKVGRASSSAWPQPWGTSLTASCGSWWGGCLVGISSAQTCMHLPTGCLSVGACFGCAVLSGQVQCHPQDALLCMPCGSVTCGSCKIPACAHTWGKCEREAFLALPCSRWGPAQSQSALPSAKPWQKSRSRLLLRTGCRWLRFWTECLGAQAAMLLMDKTKPVMSGFALLCRVLVFIHSLSVQCAWVLASIGSTAE